MMLFLMFPRCLDLLAATNVQLKNVMTANVSSYANYTVQIRLGCADMIGHDFLNVLLFSIVTELSKVIDN